jgi:hypothetical protein
MIHILSSPLKLLMHSGTYFASPTALADTFAKQFQTVHNNCDPRDFTHLSLSSGFLSLAPISNAEYFRAIESLQPSKSVALDDSPGFIIEGCSATCTCP